VPEACESPLVLIDLAAPDAARAVLGAWDRQEAVAVADPRSSKSRFAALIEGLRPTHLVDESGSHQLADGSPVAGDVAAVVTTSGTTADPRHVVLTRQAMESSARAVSASLGMAPGEDRWLACLPLHHVAGLAIVARSYFCSTPMTVHESFDENAVAASVDRCTVVSVVPTMLGRLLDVGAPLERFRHVLVGGAPLPSSLMQRAIDSGAKVTTTYGLSETCGGCAHDGKPLSSVDISTSPGDEILVKGPVVMRGYHRDQGATQAAFTSEGWLRTGDLGRIGPEGLLEVIDRIKDVIVTGGVNVSPTAVERVLVEHAAVDEVCVVGVADEEWGERVVAFVVCRQDLKPPTLDELRSFAAGRLSKPELPREIRFVGRLPYSPGGKLLRQRLRSPVRTRSAG
jgi:o-succinylbenzoate---CoA ligase